MKKLLLSDAADEFEMINAETHVFYNTKTGEFDFYSDFTVIDDEDSERFEDDCWIACPDQWDIGEYDMMTRFANSIVDPRANELLCVALEGKGAFRRFKDTLHRAGLTDKWYTFKQNAYIDLAREWCEENGIPYEGATPETKPPQSTGSNSSYARTYL